MADAGSIHIHEHHPRLSAPRGQSRAFELIVSSEERVASRASRYAFNQIQSPAHQPLLFLGVFKQMTVCRGRRNQFRSQATIDEVSAPKGQRFPFHCSTFGAFFPSSTFSLPSSGSSIEPGALLGHESEARSDPFERSFFLLDQSLMTRNAGHLLATNLALHDQLHRHITMRSAAYSEYLATLRLLCLLLSIHASLVCLAVIREF